MKAILTSIGFLALLTSCSSSMVSNPTLAPTTADYVVRERSSDSVPVWFQNFSKWKNENDGKGFIHFMGESGDVNDRISGCDLATLMAKKKIAQQIAELVSSSSGSKKQGTLTVDPLDSDATYLKHAYESMVAEKSIGFLSGVEDQGAFWERRDYSIAKGNPRVYSCSVLVRISEKDFKNAIKKSVPKNPEVATDHEPKEAKSIVSDAFKN